ncbi:hypothetical protein RCL1_000310 [Eukaryota sp. TZLM3-RCL]
MPPKKSSGASAKNQKKEINKIVEDRTFGLKNKNKSAKVQKYVEAVKAQASHNIKRGPIVNPEAERARIKKEKEQQAEMEALLNTVIVQPKLQFGQNPAEVPCAQFSATGSCPRGSKCKFSHMGKPKTEKLNLYVDQREQMGYTSKLEKINTDIVCKYFLDIVENSQYGFNWVCPNNGHDCQYRHCLPEGYVIVPKGAPVIPEEEEDPIEVLIEQERSALTSHTPLTDELFAQWKARKLAEKEQKAKADEENAQKNIAAGKKNLVSGRQLFQFDPSLFVDEQNDDGEDLPPEAGEHQDSEEENFDPDFDPIYSNSRYDGSDVEAGN